MNETALSRFWAKVNRDGPVPAHRPDIGPCWLWTAATDRFGYGKFNDGTRSVLAHVFSWEREHGKVPARKELDHLCWTCGCVRPSHLEPVSHSENIRRRHVAHGTDRDWFAWASEAQSCRAGVAT